MIFSNYSLIFFAFAFTRCEWVFRLPPNQICSPPLTARAFPSQTHEYFNLFRGGKNDLIWMEIHVCLFSCCLVWFQIDHWWIMQFLAKLLLNNSPGVCFFSWNFAKFWWAPDFVEFVLGSFSCFNIEICLFKLHFLWHLNFQFLCVQVKIVQISEKQAHPLPPSIHSKTFKGSNILMVSVNYYIAI